MARAEKNTKITVNSKTGEVTTEEVDWTAEEKAAHEAADAITYKGIREGAYPSWQDQLDLLYKDMLADKGDKTGEWFKIVKKVKDDNPKE
jgi:hypothetical protein